MHVTIPGPILVASENVPTMLNAFHGFPVGVNGVTEPQDISKDHVKVKSSLGPSRYVGY